MNKGYFIANTFEESEHIKFNTKFYFQVNLIIFNKITH